MGTRVPKPITGPTIRYQGGVGGIRVCTHFYNTEEDVDKFIDFQIDNRGFVQLEHIIYSSRASHIILRIYLI